MTTINVQDSLVLIIDIQTKLLNSVFNKQDLLKKATILANSATILDIPTIVTEQYPKGLGETIPELKNALPTNTKYYEKTSFSALDQEEILDSIKQTKKSQIIICGIETHICVNQTVSALKDAGYNVFVVKDACGSREECEHIAGLERMKDHGAKITTTEITLFEWLKSAKHPKFKEIQALIK